MAEFFLMRAIEETFEYAHHEFHLFLLGDIKLAEHGFTSLNSLVYVPLEVLGRHEIFRRILQELVLEEL